METLNCCQAVVRRTGKPCLRRSRAGDSFCGYHVPNPNCSICLCEMKKRDTHTTPCGHAFHKACLDTWTAHNKNTCPLCRASLVVTGRLRIDEILVNWYTLEWRVSRVGQFYVGVSPQPLDDFGRTLAILNTETGNLTYC